MLHAISVSSATLLAGVLSVAPLRAQEEPAARTTVVDASWQGQLTELVRAAVSQSPDLLAMKLQVDAVRHRAPQTDALPEPELELALRDVPVSDPSLTRDDFTMEVVTYRQALPARGARAAQHAAAQADVEAILAEHRGHLLEVASDIADSFFALAGIDRKLAILGDSRLRLDSATAAATERFRVGQGEQADVLRASLRSTQLEETVLTLEAERRAAASRLNALLGRAPATPIDTVAALSDHLDVELAVPPMDELVRLAQDKSSAVRAAEATVAAADAALLLLESEHKPGWMLSGYYGRRQSFEDLFGVSAAFSLPWARRSRLGEKQVEQETERSAALASVEAVRARLRGAIGEAYAELERTRQQLRLYRDVVIPQAQVQVDAAREAYAVGRVDFLTFSSAATELDEYHQAAADRAAGIGRAAAALQRASGVALLPGVLEQGGDDELH